MAALRERGQISIEFILIVTIALVYISAVVWPTVTDSAQAATDVKAVADTKLSAMKLANAFNEASASAGDMKKTISIFLPEGGKIWCTATESEIHYSTLVAYIGKWDSTYTRAQMDFVNPDIDNCTLDHPVPADRPLGFECESTIGLLEALARDCPLNATTPDRMEGPLFREVVVKKDGSGISMDWGA